MSAGTLYEAGQKNSQGKRAPYKDAGLTPGQILRVADKLLYILIAQMIREAIHLIGYLIGILGHKGTLILLSQVLASLADSLSYTA
jgi:hypothetical protein